MKKKEVSIERKLRGAKIKPLFMLVLAVVIAMTFLLYAVMEFLDGEIGYPVLLILIAAILIVLFGWIALARYRDSQRGLVSEDERSRRVMEKATSRSFMVGIYALLLIGWLSDDIIHFRDVSQATGAAILVIAISFFCFWIYYNRKEI